MNQEPAAVKSTIRQRVYCLLETYKSFKAVLLAVVIGALITVNVVAIFLESHETFKAAHSASLEMLEVVSAIIFCIEYLVRVWVSVEDPKFLGISDRKARLKYVCSLMAVIDLLAFAPSLLALTGFVQWDLRFVRAIRLLRLLKLIRYFRTLDIFFSVIKSQIANLLGTMLIIVILLIISSSMMYAVEYDPDQARNQFSSITQTVWWSVVTLTSVGYGDVIPSTDFGKILGGVIMLLGVGLVALPAAILGGKFADELQVRREKVVRHAKEKLRDGEIDAQEQDELLESGREEGFSDEEIADITESAKESVEDLRACPNCGYTGSKYG